MTIKTSTLRPGLLVSLKTSVTGNVKYSKETIKGDYLDDSGQRVAEWQTKRVITDPVEHEAAKKARSKARSLITAVCTQSAFGLLCPETAGAELDRAIREAREVASAFNAGASLTQVSVYVLTGRIAADDVEAVKAINSEIREMLEDMERGLRNCDVETIRTAASRAKQMGEMLAPEVAARVQIAVEKARMAAKRIAQSGEQAAIEIDNRAIAAVTDARTAFLDLDDAAPVQAPAVDQVALDFEPSRQVPDLAPATAPAVEME